MGAGGARPRRAREEICAPMIYYPFFRGYPQFYVYFQCFLDFAVKPGQAQAPGEVEGSAPHAGGEIG